MSLYFSSDRDLTRIRSGLEKYLGPLQHDWSMYHAEAGHRLLSDIESLWFRPTRTQKYDNGEISDRFLAFDESQLNAGWHFFSDIGQGPVTADQRVYVTSAHAAGGEYDHIYKCMVPFSSGDLTAVDFSTSDWEDVTESLSTDFRNASSYYSLYCIYRYLVTDSDPNKDPFVAHRDYFLKQYKDEMTRLVELDGIPYDWDQDSVITEEESQPSRMKLKAIW